MCKYGWFSIHHVASHLIKSENWKHQAYNTRIITIQDVFLQVFTLTTLTGPCHSDYGSSAVISTLWRLKKSSMNQQMHLKYPFK